MRYGAALLLLIPATSAAQTVAPCVTQPAAESALTIAADSTAQPARRAAAIRMLRLARYRPAIPTLVKLAEPLRGDWVVWTGALHALTEYPYAELQPFWRETLAFPRRNVREEALRGITLVGEPADMIQIRAITHKNKDDAMRALVARAERELRLPMAERVRQLDSAVAATCSREPPGNRDARSGNPRSR